MLKYDKIKVSISYRNKTHYLKLGYDPILNEDLEIDINHLSKASHVKIDVICTLCKVESKIMYYKYVMNVNRHGFYGCKRCSRQKAALTSIDRYGVDNYSKTDDWKIKVENTNMLKFGYKTNLISPDYKKNIKEILLCDMQGRLLKTEEVNKLNTQLDISSYQSGTYLIIIKTDRGISNSKLIIE
jgi:hypothetical protein